MLRLRNSSHVNRIVRLRPVSPVRNDKVQCVHSNIAIFHAELGPDQSESRVDDKLHKSAKLKWKKKSRDVSNVSPEVDRK